MWESGGLAALLCLPATRFIHYRHFLAPEFPNLNRKAPATCYKTFDLSDRQKRAFVMHADKTLSVRVPLELAHALEAKLAAVLAAHAADGDDRPRKVKNLSDVARECMSLGLRLNARDPQLIEDLKAELFGDELKTTLASGYSDPRCYELLKQIAKEVRPEPDFG